jgi:hypothetical protein
VFVWDLVVKFVCSCYVHENFELVISLAVVGNIVC